ncbi:MAG: ORF6N domain-containing protein [Leadbetterella sp.]|nr:ORF6N domain-containing protein [Leadbetterella sp.]
MSTSPTIADDRIINKIYQLRERKIMLDSDLAELYGVETKVLNQAVKRNIERFPEDFMFQLSANEHNSLRSQNVTSNTKGGRRYLPFAFTEQGVAMLSSVLKSKTAIHVNIQVIRVFTRMRELLLNNREILLKLEKVEKKLLKQDTIQHRQGKEIQSIFEVLKELLNSPQEARKVIGFEI